MSHLIICKKELNYTIFINSKLNDDFDEYRKAWKTSRRPYESAR